MRITMEKKTDFKALSSKAKVQYIWDYYRLHILSVIVIGGIVIGLTYHFVSYRKPILSVIMINVQTTSENADASFDEFSDTAGYDKKQQPIDVSTNLQFPESSDAASASSYEDYMVLSTMVGAGGQDLFFGTGDTFLDYANEGACLDLRTYISDDVLEKYKDHLIYSTDDGESESYPCAIELTDNAWIKKYGIYDGTCYFGVFSRSEQKDYYTRFADFLLNY